MKRNITKIFAALALLVTLAIPLGMWGQTVSVNDVLWTEPFKGTNTSNTFSETTSWTNYINPTTIVSTDASSLVYTSSKAMLSSTSSNNMTGAHVWLNKSVDSYIQISGIKLYNTTKVKISWAQATSGSSTTVYYQFDGTGEFTSLSTCSGPNANFESSELSVENHTTIALKFFHPSSNSKNTRIDNLTLKATEVSSNLPTHSLAFGITPANSGNVTVGNNLTSPAQVTEGEQLNITAEAETGYEFVNWTYSGTGASVDNVNSASTIFTMGTADATLTANFEEVDTYTVTYVANGPEAESVVDTYNDGATVIARPANTFTYAGYAFTGWNTDEEGNGNAYEAGETFTINGDVVLYAQWEESSEVTATLNVESYAAANSWSNSTQYTTATVAPVTFTASGGGNTGKYYTAGQEWRYYQTENASITISVPTGYHLVSITPTYNVTNTGVLLSGSTQLASGSPVSASGTSVTYTVGNSGSASNGQVKFTNIDVTYAPDATNTPIVIANPTTLDDFFYLTSHGPSATQTISVSGAQLTNDITVAVGNNSNFEISQTENSGYTNSITLAQSNGSVASTTIYVRMKGNLEAGNYSGNLSLTSDGASAVTLALAGEVVTPMTVTEAIAALDQSSPIEDAYVQGVVCQVDSYNSSYHSITYWISADGSTTGDQLQVYSGKGLNNTNFSSMDDLHVGDQVVVYGKLKIYDEIYEFDYNNYIVSLVSAPFITATDLSMTFNETAGEIAYTVSNPVQGESLTATTTDSWISNLTVDAENNKVTFSTTENDEQAARTATITLSYTGATSVNVTVTQGIYGGPVASGTITFGNANQGHTPINGANVTGTDSNENTWTITTVGTDRFNAHGNYYQVGTNDYPATSITFTMTLQQSTTFTDFSAVFGGYGSTAGDITLKVDNSVVGTGALNGTNQVTVSSSSSATGTTLTVTVTNIVAGVNCYSISYSTPTGTVSYTKTILPYTANAQTPDRYYLIASPVQGAEPSAANGFLTNDYDLYRFDQAQELEWLNYEVTPFYLLSGHGYLYANSGNNGNATTLTFTGTDYNGDGKVTLSKVNGASWEGWNLIGNPYATAAVLKDAAGTNNQAYYKMNSTGTEIEAGTLGGDIADMEGVFVIAANNGDVVTFVPSNNGKSAQLSVDVNNGTANVDRAIVRFDNGSQLPKFQLNPNNTKVYITEGDQDFAVVRSNNEGEMPVNFKASENGTYTISANAESMEMTYLHLIDNLTGADVDLLATPSYTFDARTTDYASRFKLVFKAGTGIDENTNATETFAFFNGESWSVSNQGEATLQVVDMTGRVISNNQINGNATININETAGIYMLRLVNGNNVMIQKIVVR